MAEVHPEGNPHSNHYPQIKDRSLNLIISAVACNDGLSTYIQKCAPEVGMFSVDHKRNGRHIVFEIRF
jgi:hypothetical protein